MDRKIDAGALLVTGASLLLVVSEFLHWYGVGASTSITAWQAFEVLDLVLLGCAFAAVAAAFGVIDARVVGWAAGLAVFVVLSQLVQAPPAGQGADHEVGGWVALLATIGMLAGAVLRMADIAVTVDVKGRERPKKVPTVDKRDGAPGSSAPPSGGGRKDAALFAPPAAEEPEPTVATPVDHFAPPPRPVGGDAPVEAEPDPDATQALAVPPQAEER